MPLANSVLRGNKGGLVRLARLAVGGIFPGFCALSLGLVAHCGAEAERDAGSSPLDASAFAESASPPAETEFSCDQADKSHTTVGCDFFIHRPGVSLGVIGCYVLVLVNTASHSATLSAEANGVSFDLTKFTYLPKGSGANIAYDPLPNGLLPPGAVALAFLRNSKGADQMNLACPVPPMVDDVDLNWTDPLTDFADSDLGGNAIHVTSTVPLVAYDIVPYGGGSSMVTSASLLIPRSAWGTEYLLVTPYPKIGNNSFNPMVVVVAGDDNTDVTIRPSVALVGNPPLVASSAAGTPVSYHLGRGEVLRLAQPEDLTGSILTATKPVGVWATQHCVSIDNPLACDGAHQQLPPVQALGSEYAAIRYRNRIDGRDESPPWRLVGAVDGTQLSYEPAAPSGAPTSLARGEVATFTASDAFMVRSQDANHPFYANLYMTGGGSKACLDSFDRAHPEKCFYGRGDPEFVDLVATNQFLSEYLFFTDPTYPETNLVFVRKRTTDGTFADVTLDCAGKLQGWQPFATDYEYVRVDLVRNDFEAQGKCSNGLQHASSTGSFGVTVWGWGTELAKSRESRWVSYAYPAGAGVRAVSQVELK